MYTAIMDDGEDPGPDAAPLGAVATSATPDFQEGVLGEVFRRLAFAHHPVGEGEGGTVVAVVERCESLGVRRLDEGDQVLVGEYQVVPSPVRHTLILRQPQGPGSTYPAGYRKMRVRAGFAQVCE